MINIVIHVLEKIKEQLVSFEYSEIPYSSLLIVYDSDYFLKFEFEVNEKEKDGQYIHMNHEGKNENIQCRLDSYIKDKLNLKIIDFAYFRDEHLENFIIDEHLTDVTGEKNITDAIHNLIQILKNNN